MNFQKVQKDLWVTTLVLIGCTVALFFDEIKCFVGDFSFSEGVKSLVDGGPEEVVEQLDVYEVNYDKIYLNGKEISFEEFKTGLEEGELVEVKFGEDTESGNYQQIKQALNEAKADYTETFEFGVNG